MQQQLITKKPLMLSRFHGRMSKVKGLNKKKRDEEFSQQNKAEARHGTFIFILRKSFGVCKIYFKGIQPRVIYLFTSRFYSPA